MLFYSSLLYSAAAVRRMLHLSPQVPVEVREFDRVIWVWVEGQRPQFWSKHTFKQHFRNWRKQQSQAVTVRQLQPNQFVAWAQDKDTTYLIEVKPAGVFCTCEDFQQQVAQWQKGCCKHGYAVLKKLGYPSLQAYLNSQDAMAA